jgi:hypothetical protein
LSSQRTGDRHRVDLFRSPFSCFHTGPAREERIAGYIVREHRRGRTLSEILEDPYLRCRWTDAQLRVVLATPSVLRALADDIVDLSTGPTRRRGDGFVGRELQERGNTA